MLKEEIYDTLKRIIDCWHKQCTDVRDDLSLPAWMEMWVVWITTSDTQKKESEHTLAATSSLKKEYVLHYPRKGSKLFCLLPKFPIEKDADSTIADACNNAMRIAVL